MCIEMRNSVLAIVTEAVRTLAEDRDLAPWRDPTRETRLQGAVEDLDSLALIALAIEVEERTGNRFETHVALADGRVVGQSAAPFATIASLVDYIVERVQQGRTEPVDRPGAGADESDRNGQPKRAAGRY